MEALLSITAVATHHDVKGLRKLHNSVEAHVRGLRALGVPPDSYGGLLTSILVNKLPSEVRLIVSRATTRDSWNLDEVMKIFEQEIDARERASLLNISDSSRKMHTRTPTAAALIANDSTPTTTNVNCVYCGQGHLSASCTTISDVPTRKEALRKAGRCYVCLKKYHLSKDCRSHIRCQKCRGRHHITICPRQIQRDSNTSTSPG